MEYKLCKKYVVADSKEELENSKTVRLLISYLPDKARPFVCVANNWEEDFDKDEIFCATLWKYAKPFGEEVE